MERSVLQFERARSRSFQMYQVARAWSGRCVGLALISLGLCGCNEAGSFGLESSDVAQLASPLLAGDGGAECAAEDRSCDGVDDDCDGQSDEDFVSMCFFGGVATMCVEGHIVSESCNDANACTSDSC